MMWIIDLLMVFGPIVGYAFQYSMMRESKSLGNFSIDICGIILISNILRIIFWFAVGFDITLLFQSIVMVITQFVLLQLCLRIKSDKLNQNSVKICSEQLQLIKQEQINEKESTQLWRWNEFQVYIKFISLFSFVNSIIALLFIHYFQIMQFGNLVGYAAMSIQSIAAFPQLLQNYRAKSVEGLSTFLIFAWVSGDLGKTIFYIVDNQPIQFLMCGIIQLTIDLLLTFQICFYKKQILNHKHIPLPENK